MTPLPEIRKSVATRSALPSGVTGKGAVMPPYFNLLLVISSYPHCFLRIFVQSAHGKILCFLHQIGHRGNGGFTSVFCHSCPLTAESVRTVCKSRLSEVGRCTFPTGKVISQRPPKLGQESVMVICFLRLATCHMAK